MVEKSTDHDVIIIGGGPAGLSAALWCADLGLDAVLFEKESEFGGQLLWIHNPIANHLGIEAANGRELRDRFLQHIETVRVNRLVKARVERVDLTRRLVHLIGEQRRSARSIIIATGVRRRRLDIPGEQQFRARGILESGTRERHSVKGRTVLIVGGGDAALENALILSETARKVFVVHRRGELTARGEFTESSSEKKNIEFLFNSRPTAITGNESVEAVEVENTLTKAKSTIQTDNVLFRIGVVPNSELFAGQIDLDESGYITTDVVGATNLDLVFAIGDVANPTSPTISGAVGNGATAVKAIRKLIQTQRR